MTKLSTELILEIAGRLYARNGEDNFTVRKLAKELKISPSVVYYYFKDESVLLRAMFDYLNHELGLRRAALPRMKSAKRMLQQRIEFQIDNQQAIVAVLKYYLSFRSTFPRFKNGFVPDKSALHIEEVLRFGIETGEFRVVNLEDDAKVITHAINGFLLEYFPHTPHAREKKELVSRIYSFLLRALQ